MALFKRTPQPDAESRLFDLKASMITYARATAKSEKREPTLEDYRQACLDYAGQDGISPDQWNPKIYSDLSGQDLNGFKLTDPNVPAAGNRPMSKLLNLDSDGTINDFYTNVNLFAANLKDAFIDPATSFNAEIAKAKSLDGIKFNGMEIGDVFTFRGEAEYKNIQLTGINGGEIRFGDNARVNDLKIDGLQASIALGQNAYANHLSMNDNFRILNIEAAQGAVLANSDLSNATISMASNLNGARFDNVKIGNISHVDFTGASLQNVVITGDAKGADFTGAIVQNLIINNQLITSSQQLQDMGVAVNSATVIGVSEDMREQIRLDAARKEAVEVVLASESFNPSAAANNAQNNQKEAGSDTDEGDRRDQTVKAEAAKIAAVNPLQQSAQILPISKEGDEKEAEATTEEKLETEQSENPEQGHAETLEAQRENALKQAQEQQAQAEAAQEAEQPDQQFDLFALEEAEARNQELEAQKQQEQSEVEEQQEAKLAKAPRIEMSPDMQAEERSAQVSANDNAIPQDPGLERAQKQAEEVQLAAVMWKGNEQQQGAQVQEVALQAGLQNNSPDQGAGASIA